MTETAKDSAAAIAEALLIRYTFERGAFTAEELIAEWLEEYPASWIRLAAIEALYQGRYKAVSVAHILGSWKRRNQPLYHFNHEFERLVCSKFPQGLTSEPPQVEAGSKTVEAAPETTKLSENKSDSASGAETPRQQTNGGKAEAIAPPEVEGEAIATPAPDPEPPTWRTASDEPDARAELTSVKTSIAVLEANEQLNLDLLGDHWRDAAEFEIVVSPEPEPAAEPAGAGDAVGESYEERSGGSEDKGDEKLPVDGVEASTKHKPDWSRFDTTKRPIHQFTPKFPTSDFHAKLKAVAQPKPDFQANPSGEKPLNKKGE